MRLPSQISYVINIMAYNFVKACEFLALDGMKMRPSHYKYVYPVINHLFAIKYAQVLDGVIDFSDPEREAKPISLIFHKMVSHTFKHILHKYKRVQSLSQIQRAWTVRDFHTSEGKHENYIDYPLAEDLVALKKEIGRITRAKIDVYNEEHDIALDGLNIGALCDLSLYKTKEFKKDFDVVHELWLDLLRFTKEQIELTNTKQLPESRIQRGFTRLK